MTQRQTGEVNQSERKKRVTKIKDSFRDFWDNTKHSNICIIGIPEGEACKKKKGNKNCILKKYWLKTFPTCKRKQTLRSKKHSILNKMNPKIPTPEHIVVEVAKVKEAVLNEAREKQVTFKGDPTGLPADFSTATLQARREWLGPL